jgi:hypothetical protein
MENKGINGLNSLETLDNLDGLDTLDYLKSRGAISLKLRRQVRNSWAVPSET